jgi:ATP-dependent Lon protease
MPRPKGSPNKLTAEIKQKLSEVIMDAMSSIDIDSMTQNEKLKLIQIGLTYVIPKLKQVENIEEEEPRNFQFEIIDSLNKYSNYEIDKAIKNKL